MFASALAAVAVFSLALYAGITRGRVPAPALRGKAASPVFPHLLGLAARLCEGVRRTPSSSLWEEVFYAIAFHIKAGEALPQAIRAVSDEGSGSPYEALRKVVRSYEAGASMLQALQSASGGSPEMHRLAAAVEIGLSTGSDLPLLLCHSALILAKRRSLRKEARAKLAESRLTAALLSGMPWLIGAVTYRYNPGLLSQALSGPRGSVIIAASLGLWLAGNVAIFLILASATGARAR